MNRKDSPRQAAPFDMEPPPIWAAVGKYLAWPE